MENKASPQILGIDVGGSGIKGAPVDIHTGKLTAERIRIKTPGEAEPKPVAEVIQQIVGSFNGMDAIGIGFPAPIKSGVAMMAANISEKWVGLNADELFTKTTGLPAKRSTMPTRPAWRRCLLARDAASREPSSW